MYIFRLPADSVNAGRLYSHTAVAADRPSGLLIGVEKRMNLQGEPDMQFRRRNKVTAVGVTVVAMGLTLAACSSNTPSGSSSPSAGAASGPLHRRGSSFQNTLQQAAASAFPQAQPALPVNYERVGSGAAARGQRGAPIVARCAQKRG